MQNSKQSLWQTTAAPNVSKVDAFILTVLFAFGIASVIHFALWWFQEKHIDRPWLFYTLSVLFWYGLIRLVFVWYAYMSIKKPITPEVSEGLSVAIFTTSYKNEPIEMIEKTLEACSKITYPHTTYLLDNTEDPAYRYAAEEYGAVWLELVNIPGAKAGKINKALSLTQEEFILILDPDHIPFPNFFDEILGFFTDPKVGFVQVSQGYYNQHRSFVAKAAAQQTYTFYGATQMGYYGNDCAIAIGANCTFRRSALESIGGHVVGLAEDLQTSLQLHAAGWKSVYNPVIVNRGLVPEDFNTFCSQQVKWARGATELLFTDIPKVINKLHWKQKLTYLSIASYYISGFTTFLFILFPFVFVIAENMPVNMLLSEFFVYGSWVMLSSILFTVYTQKWMCNTKGERGFHIAAMILKYATWPVFFYALLLTLINKQIPYVPTDKTAGNKKSPFLKPLVWYIFICISSFLVLIIYRLFFIQTGDLIASSSRVWVMVGFASVVFVISIISLIIVKKKYDLRTKPWNEIHNTFKVHTI